MMVIIFNIFVGFNYSNYINNDDFMSRLFPSKNGIDFYFESFVQVLNMITA